jgi:hypothetical protein
MPNGEHQPCRAVRRDPAGHGSVRPRFDSALPPIRKVVSGALTLYNRRKERVVAARTRSTVRVQLLTDKRPPKLAFFQSTPDQLCGRCHHAKLSKDIIPRISRIRCLTQKPTGKVLLSCFTICVGFVPYRRHHLLPTHSGPLRCSILTGLLWRDLPDVAASANRRRTNPEPAQKRDPSAQTWCFGELCAAMNLLAIHSE